MSEINRLTNTGNSAKYIRQLSEEQRVRVQSQHQEQKVEERKKVEKDQISISQEAKQLSEAQELYRKFLEEKAKEIETERMQKIKELKRKLQERPNTPLNQIAEKIAKEYFGMG